jgi:hypothetical protein
MWACPDCRRIFANRNQSHACGRYQLDDHFTGGDPGLRAVFDRVVEVAATNGPVSVVPEKTRIALQARTSFAAFTVRRRWIHGHVVLARRLEHPRFRRIDTMSARNHVHLFRLATAGEVDDVVAGWLAEAYVVGIQRHLD